jgi:hypothetical protein
MNLIYLVSPQRFTWFLSLMICLLALRAMPVLAWDKDSLAQLQPLAEKGNAEAQYHVGMLYSLGIGGASKDHKLAFAWFEKSTAGNDPLGAYKLGCFYAGQYAGVVVIDTDKALTYKLISAKAGYALAEIDVAGTYYRRGEFAEAAKWLQMAAEQGYPQAAMNLSTLYFEGKGVARDLVKSYAWLKFGYAAARQKLDARGQEALDKIARDMTPADIAAADTLASGWRATPTELTVAARTPKPRVEALLAQPTVQ